MPKVTIVIINYNGQRFIQSCLKSLLRLTYQNKEIIFIDNNSTDESVKIMRENYPQVVLFANKDNKGYTGAANQGIKAATGRYVMLMNLDIIFEKDYLEKAVKKMESDHRIGALSGKLFRYDFEKNRKTDYIDTLGLHCFRNRRIIDKAQGSKDKVRYDISKEVFGVSGCCPLYRLSALKDIAVNDEIFDEDFFMYKEDVDVSWRLRLRGWKCYYLADAVAYHGRGTGILSEFDDRAVLESRKHLSLFQKHHAYKNQRLMQIKNELWGNLLRDALPILKKEALISSYILLREPRLLKSVLATAQKIPAMLSKRRQIMKNKKVDWKDMEVWLRGEK